MKYLAYKFRLYPNREQETLLLQHVGSCRYVWNYFLAKNIEMYEKEKKFIFYSKMSPSLVPLKKLPETSWLRNVNSQSLQESLRHLDLALRGSFKGKVNRKGFPRFKSKKNVTESFTVPQHFKIFDKHIAIPKIKTPIRFRKHREIIGVPLYLTIVKEINHWFVSITCAVENTPLMNAVIKEPVGIDLGIKDFAILSSGEVFSKPDEKELKKKLKKYQRKHSKHKKGSKRREKARIAVAKIYRKMKNVRKDFHHKVSNSIAKDYDFVSVENLNVKGMVKNRKLSEAISSQGWSSFVNMLEYKVALKGNHFHKVGKFFPSSKTCSNCGWIQDMPLSVRTYECYSCGMKLDRDLNAAINIRQEGLRNIAGTAKIYARGDTSDGELESSNSSHVSRKREALATFGCNG